MTRLKRKRIIIRIDRLKTTKGMSKEVVQGRDRKMVRVIMKKASIKINRIERR